MQRQGNQWKTDLLKVGHTMTGVSGYIETNRGTEVKQAGAFQGQLKAGNS